MFRITSIPPRLIDVTLTTRAAELDDKRITLVNVLMASDNTVWASFVFEGFVTRPKIASLVLNDYNADAVKSGDEPMTVAEFFDSYVIEYDVRALLVPEVAKQFQAIAPKRRKSLSTDARRVLAEITSEAEYGNAGIVGDLAKTLKLTVRDVRRAVGALVANGDIVHVGRDSYELRCEEGSNS